MNAASAIELRAADAVELINGEVEAEFLLLQGWPWPDSAPVHGREPARFALRPGGHEERPSSEPAIS